MKSVTDQILGDGALQQAIDEGIVKSDELHGADPVQPETRNAELREKQARAKLNLAMATADRTKAPVATGVQFAMPQRGQAQMIFTDGSVRNPFKINREMTGRQRRKLRKQTNRKMKARGIDGHIEDVLKGYSDGTLERPQPATPESPAPAQPAPQSAEAVGMSVADVLGD